MIAFGLLAVTLVAGQSVARPIGSRQAHAYRLDLERGDFVRLAVAQKGADVAVSIVGPTGRVLASANVADFRFGDESLSAVATATGRHQVVVRSGDRFAPAAPYELTVVERRPEGPGDQARIAAERAHAEAKRLQRVEKADEYRRSIEAFADAGAKWRALGEPRQEAAARIESARSSMMVGDYAEARKAAQEALAASRGLGDRTHEARALHLLGEVHYHLSEYPAALESLREALALRRTLGDPWGEAETLGDVSSVLAQTGQTQESLETARESLAMWRRVKHLQGEESAMSVLGYAHYRRGEWQAALDLFTEALPLKRKLGDREGEAATLSNIGSVYGKLGEYESAIGYFEQALPIWRGLGHRKGEGTTLNNLAATSDSLDRTDAATRYYEQALALRRAVGDRDGEGVTLVNIGILQIKAGRTAAARERLTEALQVLDTIADSARRSDAVTYLGRVHAAEGDYVKAKALLEEALGAKRKTGDATGQMTALFHLARAARDEGDLAAARRHIEAAVALVESIRTTLRSGALRASYGGSVREVYELYIDILARGHEREPQAGLDRESLRASERARARGLLELLAAAQVDVRAGAEPALREREKSLQAELGAKLDQQVRLLSRKHTPEQAEATAREVETLIAAYDEVRTRIQSASPRYAALTQPAAVELEEVQRELLDADTVLLEYAVGKDRSFVWAVTHDAIALHPLPGAAVIEDAVRATGRAMSTRAPSAAAERDLSRQLAALSKMLLGPVAGVLGDRRLVVVPDGVLHYLPFGALPDPAAPDRPLIARHEVVSLPSASVLAVLREEMGQRRPAPKTVAVLADPVFDRKDERVGSGLLYEVQSTYNRPDPSAERAARALGFGLPRLPFTRREAAGILSLVPARARKEALDFDASRATATASELGEYRFVHFATHGFLNAARPELSGIVLSLVDKDGRDQNGFLAAPEVFNLKLGADLVVLSGCRTGLGREVRGEGLVGLTRAFMYAGAPRLLASLWKVDDAATAELMTHVYRGILTERLSPAAALRRAQMALHETRRWRSPYFWAAFQLHGDWKGPAEP
jgi:CHAT domain-containing protein/Tfp pilus assembly protein PilF